MILKIATYGDERKAQWRFIDDIGEIATMPVFLRRTKREDGEEVVRLFKTEACKDKSFPDMVFLPDSLVTRPKLGSVIRVSALLAISRAKVGSQIVFHEAYLMNDEGKTVERL